MATTIFDQRGQRVENQHTEIVLDESRSKKLREVVASLEKEMQCNCELDFWKPEKATGHSWVCRIHKKALRLAGIIKEE